MSTVERETRELVLEKSNITVVLFDYITGQDKRDIKKVFMASAKLTTKQKVADKASGEVSIEGITGDVEMLMTDAALKAVVKEVKVDDQIITNKEEILKFILNLRESEYDKIVEAVNAITDPKAVVA